MVESNGIQMALVYSPWLITMNPAFCTPLMSSGASRFHVNQKEKSLESIPLITTAVAIISRSCYHHSQNKAQLTEEYALHSKPLTYSSTPDHNTATRYQHSGGDCTIKQCISIPLLVVQQTSQWSDLEDSWHCTFFFKGHRHGVVGRLCFLTTPAVLLLGLKCGSIVEHVLRIGFHAELWKSKGLEVEGCRPLGHADLGLHCVP